jgi:hypothetical protein
VELGIVGQSGVVAGAHAAVNESTTQISHVFVAGVA